MLPRTEFLLIFTVAQLDTINTTDGRYQLTHAILQQELLNMAQVR